MQEIDFSKIKSVHFIGIGGIGISAVVRYFLAQGKKVSGSDRARSEIIEALEKEGAAVSIGEQDVGEIPNSADLVIYSAALEVAEPTLITAVKKLSIPSLSYSEALGEISRGKRTIAVSGTHGKTTTTAMIASVLIDAGFDPTVIVGSLMHFSPPLLPEEGNKRGGGSNPLSNLPLSQPPSKRSLLSKGGTGGEEKRSNFRTGKSNWLVVEADEYRRSFLSLSPEMLVITNIDRDHLDYFKDIADIRSAYAELAAKVPKRGAIITDFSDENIGTAVRAARAPLFDYASVDSRGLSLKFPGAHNIRNARAAIAVAAFLGIPREAAIRSLNNFQGTWRRFEYAGETECGALVYDDYAHNPAKIRALLSGVRERFPKKRIIAIFQPHLYSRTKTLLPEFAESFGDADLIILAPIFPAREKPDSSISSDILAEEIKKQTDKEVLVFDSFKEIAKRVNAIAGKDDVVLTMGAGDIYKVAQFLIQ